MLVPFKVHAVMVTFFSSTQRVRTDGTVRTVCLSVTVATVSAVPRTESVSVRPARWENTATKVKQHCLKLVLKYYSSVLFYWIETIPLKQ